MPKKTKNETLSLETLFRYLKGAVKVSGPDAMTNITNFDVDLTKSPVSIKFHTTEKKCPSSPTTGS